VQFYVFVQGSGGMLERLAATDLLHVSQTQGIVSLEAETARRLQALKLG
jgi:hypothetical protein